MEPTLAPESDSEYLARALGGALKQALAEICERKPWDPIEYLAHWLKNHSANADYERRIAMERVQIQIAREEAHREAAHKAMLRAEAKHIRREEERRKMMFLDRSSEIEDIEKAAELEASAAGAELLLPEVSRDEISPAEDQDIDTFRSDDLAVYNEARPASANATDESNVEGQGDQQGTVESEKEQNKPQNDIPQTEEMPTGENVDLEGVQGNVGDPQMKKPLTTDEDAAPVDGSVEETTDKTTISNTADDTTNQTTTDNTTLQKSDDDTKPPTDEEAKAAPTGSLNTIQEED